MTPEEFQTQSETWFSFLKGFIDGFIVPTGKLIAAFGQFLFDHPAWTIALIVGVIALGLLIKYAWKVGLVVAGVVLLVGVGAWLWRGGSEKGNLWDASFAGGDGVTEEEVAERLLESLEQNKAGTIETRGNTVTSRLDTSALFVAPGVSLADLYGVERLAMRITRVPQAARSERLSLDFAIVYNPLAFRFLDARWAALSPVAHLGLLPVVYAQEGADPTLPQSVWWQTLGFVKKLEGVKCTIDKIVVDQNRVSCQADFNDLNASTNGGGEGDEQQKKSHPDDQTVYLECIYPPEWVEKIAAAERKQEKCLRRPDDLECSLWDSSEFEKLLETARKEVPPDSFRCRARVENIGGSEDDALINADTISDAVSSLLEHVAIPSGPMSMENPTLNFADFLVRSTACRLRDAKLGELLSPYEEFKANRCVAEATESLAHSSVEWLKLLAAVKVMLGGVGE